MDNRLALIGIIVEDYRGTDEVNSLLHEYRDFIIGRMGLPHVRTKVCIISITIDAPADTISALSGKLGMIDGITTQTLYAKSCGNDGCKNI